MAWQLIYTSAPRLLEAGRTGFGTVARHRAVGELVAGAVERVSQFARLSGLGARRVIRSHRIITAGASQVHVFSCIRDAGSDYTGRTNHLAHHLIAEPREVRLAAEAGITPADILAQMKWRTTWSEPPRFLEPLEEVSLMSLRARTLGSAWEQLIGHAESSTLPTQTARCFMILPGEADALPLIQESLRHVGAESMQVTFTTHLEPTDDVAGFRWAAMNASSPLRQQADGIARTVLDLTQPQSLPKIGAALSAPAARTARESFVPMSVMTTAVADTSAPMTTLPSSFMESLHPLPKSRPGSFTGIVMAAVLVISTGIGAYFWLDQQPKRQHPAAAVDLATQVDALWKKHHLALPLTATWLKGKADASLTESHDKSLRALFQSLRQPLQLTEIPRPESTQDEFMDMLQAYTQWQRKVSESVRQEIWSSGDPAEIKIEARVRMDQEQRLWKSFAENFQRAPLHPETLKEEISTQTLKQLTQSIAPSGAAEDWRDILFMTTLPMPRWPELWVIISHLPAFPAALSETDQVTLSAAAKDTSAPSWLQQMATRRLSQIQEMNQTEADAAKAAQAMQKPLQAELQITAADGPRSAHPRFIVMETEEIDLKHALQEMPNLPVQENMQILAGSAGFAESNLVRWRLLGGAGVYRKSFTESDTLEIKEQRLVKAPSDEESWRIIGRSSTGSEVLFEVLLLVQKKMPQEVWHSDAGFTFQTQYANQRTTLDKAAARWLTQLVFMGAKPQLRLQSLEDPVRRFRVRLEAGEAVVEIETKRQQAPATTARVSAITAEIENLKQGIRTDEQRKAEVAEGNLAKREKEDSQIRAQQAISTKEMRILEMQEEMRGLTALTATPAPLKGIPTGRYALAAVTFDQAGRETAARLCELNLTSQQAKNEP
jgi:GTPase-associated protein 1, N-terminal domain type 2